MHVQLCEDIYSLLCMHVQVCGVLWLDKLVPNIQRGGAQVKVPRFIEVLFLAIVERGHEQRCH